MILFPVIGNGQITFQKTYNFPTNLSGTYANEVLQTPDGGFITTSSVGVPGIGSAINGRPLIMKLDLSGEIEWSRYYESNNQTMNWFSHTILTDDNGDEIPDAALILSNDVSALNTDFGYLTKIDFNGNVLWAKKIENTQFDLTLLYINQTSDGGYIICGNQKNGGSGSGNFYAIKLDASGNFVWDFSLGVGGTNTQYAHAIKELSDGNYLLVGRAIGNGAFSGMAYIIKLSPNGTIIWEKGYKVSDGEAFTAFVETADNNIVLLCRAFQQGNNIEQIRLLKIDTDGNMIWAKRINHSSLTLVGMNIIETSDAGLLVSGNLGLNLQQNALMVKTDADGNMLWNKRYNGSILSYGITLGNKSVVETSDQGLAFTVHMFNSTEKIRLIKTDETGEDSCANSTVLLTQNNINFTTPTPQTSVLATATQVSNTLMTPIDFSTTVSTICEAFCVAPTLDSTQYTICDEACIQFDNPAPFDLENTTYIWTFSDGKITQELTPNICFTHSGISPESIDLSIRSISPTGCQDTLIISDFITLSSTPNPEFNHEPEAVFISDPLVNFESLANSNTTHLWQFGDGSQSTLPSETHIYPQVAKNYLVKHTVSDLSGQCTATAEATVRIKDELVFFVPNSFTPSQSNQLNNTFKPIMTSGFDPYQYHLVIYNKWGNICFESYDANVGWDGYYNGALAKAGVYIWKIDFKANGLDQRHTQTGHLTLLH